MSQLSIAIDRKRLIPAVVPTVPTDLISTALADAPRIGLGLDGHTTGTIIVGGRIVVGERNTPHDGEGNALPILIDLFQGDGGGEGTAD